MGLDGFLNAAGDGFLTAAGSKTVRPSSSELEQLHLLEERSAEGEAAVKIGEGN